MPKVCFYLHLHQPPRLTNISVFGLGTQADRYFQSPEGENDQNRKIFLKVAEKSYLPMLHLLGQLLQTEPGFKCAFSISGVFIEQAQRYQPKILEILKRIVATGKAELLGETYYHSLASLYSPSEFKIQVKRHSELLEDLFGFTPKVFRNTELIYSNQIGEQVSQLPFTGILTEAVGRYLWDRPKTKVYFSYTKKKVPLLLKHAELSDDIAFRFSDKNWKEHPLSAERYLEWVEMYQETEFVNLFMDFETFGEHQWADTGIFQFWAAFVHQFLARPANSFVTPSEEIARALSEFKQPSDIPDWRLYDVPEPISWADVDRDVTAWRDNVLQQDTLRTIYELEPQILGVGDKRLVEDWRKLQTSDHFYYMCTKWSADGDVHAYFSPYQSPYEAYRRYSIALADIQERLLQKQANGIFKNIT
ncbi:MAG: alpha-amylase [Candidatus Pacebacteria bacterium CG10_big_fil_rev_8_21_14_0_10_44_11]|nr:MAG: alpha-amylase [Candidatus Pacebacteria bacterium CG10_big_fil_rev_8_21_14_0_10_44_11]